MLPTAESIFKYLGELNYFIFYSNHCFANGARFFKIQSLFVVNFIVTNNLIFPFRDLMSSERVIVVDFRALNRLRRVIVPSPKMKSKMGRFEW